MEDLLSLSLVYSVVLKFRTFLNVKNGCIFLRITGLIHKRHRSPWLWNDALYSWTPSGREHDKCLQIIHGFTNKVVENPAHFSVIPLFLSLLTFVLFCFELVPPQRVLDWVPLKKKRWQREISKFKVLTTTRTHNIESVISYIYFNGTSTSSFAECSVNNMGERDLGGWVRSNMNW